MSKGAAVAGGKVHGRLKCKCWYTAYHNKVLMKSVGNYTA